MGNYAGEVDEEESGKFTFVQFCSVAAKFMVEDDEEQMKEELKEAFRIYDKECQGFITNDVLKDILREIDSTLTEEGPHRGGGGRGRLRHHGLRRVPGDDDGLDGTAE